MDCTVKVKVMSVGDRNHADDAFGVGLMAGLGGAVIVFVLSAVLVIVGITKLVESGRERKQAMLGDAGSNRPTAGPYLQP